MGQRPSPEHSIERDDVHGNYEPSNCRWATQIEQHNNKRNNAVLTIDAETLTVAEWARKIGADPATIYSRIYLGWSAKEAVYGTDSGRRYRSHHPWSKFILFRGERMQISDAARSVGLRASDLCYHMKRGRTPDEAADFILRGREKRRQKARIDAMLEEG